MVNKILVTNALLCKIKKIDSDDADLCSFCKLQPENIHHLFLDCTKVKEFWILVKSWMSTHAHIEMNFDNRNIILSVQGQNELINYIYVIAKYYVYKTKFSGKPLNIQAFISILKKKFFSEKYIAYIHNRVDKFFKKWSPLYNYFNT